jgi:hypothetical protein
MRMDEINESKINKVLETSILLRSLRDEEIHRD